MKLYELNYLLPLSSEGDDAQKIALEIESFIQGKGGILTQERRSKKVELGYAIQGHKNALFVTSEFQVDPSAAKDLQDELKKMNLLRSLLEIKRKRRIKKKRTPRASRGEDEIKVELDKIEEKLDEILNES